MSGLAHQRRLKEWCRPLGALPSRMRDRGVDIVPPDVRLAGKPCGHESSVLDIDVIYPTSATKENGHEMT